MILSLALDAVLAALVLAVAIGAIAARTAFTAVIGFVAYGMLLALVWVRLAAADVALTEAAIGSGVTGALLIRAAGRLRGTEAQTAVERPRIALGVLAGVLCASVSAALAVSVLTLPDPAPTLAPEAAANLPATELGNPVNAVLIAYRAYDTLLEKFVLLLALIGVWSLAADRNWGGSPEIPHQTESGGVLKFLGQLLPPVGIVVAIHVLWAGANEPGGAFQAGTILAAMWILAMMAGLTNAPPINKPWLRIVLVAGPAVFLAVGLSGFGLAGAFLAYPTGFTKPLILIIEAALTMSIAAMLGMLAAGPPQRRTMP